MAWKDRFVHAAEPADSADQAAQEQAYARRRAAFYQQIAQAQALPERTLYYHEPDTRTLSVLGLGVNRKEGMFTHMQAPMTAHEPDGTKLYAFEWHAAPIADLMSLRVSDGSTPCFPLQRNGTPPTRIFVPAFS